MFSAFHTLFFLSFFLSCAHALCECGFNVKLSPTNNSSPIEATFINTIESDFTQIQQSSWDPDWFIVTYNQTTGFLGKIAETRNVLYNHVVDNTSTSSPGIFSGDPGVQLIVRSTLQNGMVPMGELRTKRQDIQYGSFRSRIKFTGINGTCGASFWYYNDTQEIDMEVLSREQSTSSSALNLVLQSEQSAQADFNAANTSSFEIAQLGFRADAQFHEYRMDWTPDQVSFFVDGNWIAEMTTNVPVTGGRLVFNHWSNGNPGWSAGPPVADATMTVAYMKAYFNSSDPSINQDFSASCVDPGVANASCQVLDNPDFWITKTGNVSGSDSPSSTSTLTPMGTAKSSAGRRGVMKSAVLISLIYFFL
ncbi:glycoside hydrolase family 16 protein [Hyaloscypha hepaticicola]|uniref:Glycoside hydrolase family 16 protein n=1 Tax=Hyaloscypha hepaticicola TaxID=2082293 RepID=A0A2J6Q2W5_9HELO|nr:glycoside hydrolase family 16 protein [Hyaloscypha hepaticicola]